MRTWWRFARWSRESAPAEQMKIAPHEGWSEWITNPSGLHNIVAELRRRRFSESDVDKIMGGNFLRVFRANFG